MSTLSILAIGIHALIAWVVLEVYVNNAHRFSRLWYVLFHYAVVIFTFGVVFTLYFRFFSGVSVFWVTSIGMAYMIALEVVVFRYLYSGERWFLNFVDWIFPMFLAATTIYTVGMLIG